MIPDFPDNIRIRLAQLIFLCFSELRQPTGQRLSKVRTQQKNLIRPILFLYYEESLIIKFEFNCVRPNKYTFSIAYSSFLSVLLKLLFRTFQYKRPCMRIERHYLPDFFFISFLTSISANCVRVVSSVMLDKD